MLAHDDENLWNTRPNQRTIELVDRRTLALSTIVSRPMTGLISIQCPKCRSNLKLKSVSSFGKKVACPKCKYPFVLKKPKPEPVVDEFDSFDEFDEEDYGATAPMVSGRKSSKKPGGSKVKKSGDLNLTPVLIAGGVLLIVGLLVGLGWMLFGSGDQLASGPADANGIADSSEPPVDAGGVVGPDAVANQRPAGEVKVQGINNQLNLAYLPLDAELVVAIKMADLWNESLVKSLIQNPQTQATIDEIQENYGLGPDEIDMVMVGIGEISNAGLQAQQGASPQELVGTTLRDNVIVVVHTKAPYSVSKLKANPQSEVVTTQNAKTYYRRKPTPVQGMSGMPTMATKAAWIAEPKTVVFGSEPAIREVMNRSETQVRREDLDFVDSHHQLVVAFVPRIRDVVMGQVPQSDPNRSPGMANLIQALKTKVKGLSLGMSLNQGINLKLQLSCTDFAGSTDIKSAFDLVLADAKTAFVASKEQFLPALAQLGESVLNSVESNEQSGLMEVTVEVSDAFKELWAFETFAQLSEHLMAAKSFGPTSSTLATDFQTTRPVELTPSAAAVVKQGDLEQKIILFNKAPFGIFAPHGKNPLFATLELQGPTITTASSVGFVTVEKAQDDRGKELKQLKHDWTTLRNNTTQFVELNRLLMFPLQFDKPQDAIQIHFMVEQADPQAMQLAVLQGSLQLRVGGEKKVVLVPEVISLEGKEVDDTTLKEASVKVEIGDSQNDSEKSVVVSITDLDNSVVDVELLDDQGDVLHQGTSWSIVNKVTRYVLSAEKPVPNNAHVRITLHVNRKSVKVPFKFEKLALPSAE